MGKLPFTLSHKHADHETLEDAKEAKNKLSKTRWRFNF